MRRYWSPSGLYCKFLDKYHRLYLMVNSPLPGPLWACVLVSSFSTTIIAFINLAKELTFMVSFEVRVRCSALKVSAAQSSFVVVLHLSPSKWKWVQLNLLRQLDKMPLSWWGQPVVGLDSTQGDRARLEAEETGISFFSVSQSHPGTYNKTVYVTLLYRHESFTGKHTTRQIHTKPHPRPE